MTDADRDLLRFLAHSLELESDAEERYSELADSLASHHNHAVADFFRRMAAEAARHREEVATLAGGRELPPLAPWDYNWPGTDAPESCDYESVHYRMDLREAITLALANERRAHDFYRQVAEHSGDEYTSMLAARFAGEELQHAAALEQLLAETPPSTRFHRQEDDEPTLPE